MPQRLSIAKQLPCRVRIVLGLRRWVLSLAALFFCLPHVAQATPVSPDAPCLALLSSGSTEASPGKTDQRTAGVSEAAGKAATLSLLLGVRLALGPVEDLSIRNDHESRAVLSALDIARYRTCMKTQALVVSSLK